MKYITCSLYVIAFCVALSLSCSTKKDIISEQSAAPSVNDQALSDNSTKQGATETALGTNAVQDIQVQQNGEVVNVDIITTGKPNYTIFKLTNPERVIVDLPDTVCAERLSVLAIDNNIVKEIKTTNLTEKNLQYERIEIFLKGNAVSTSQSNDNTITVRLQNKSNLNTVAAPSTTASITSPLLININTQKIGGANFIKFNLTNSVPNYNAFKLQNPPRLVIELPNTQQQNPSGSMDVQENLISKIRFGQKEKYLRVVFDMIPTADPDYKIVPSSNALNIYIGPEAIAQIEKIDSETAPKDAIQPQKPSEIVPQTAQESKEAGKESSAGKEKAESIYTGEKISLDFKDADIKNVIRLLGDIGGINMTIGDKVSGKVTLRLENVPCDEALDIVLINNGLDKVVTRNYTRIDTVDSIKKFNDERAQAKRAHEQAEDIIVKTFSISYADASSLVQFIKQMSVLTPNRGSVTSFALTNKLTVTDIPSAVAKVEKIIAEQDIPTRQVMIEAKVIQSSPNWTRELGIRWGGTYNGHDGNALVPITGAGVNNSVVDLLTSANGAINIGYIKDKYTLDVTLTAAENEDKVKILSHPRVLTLDNKESTIKQGVQLPYLKLNENGVTSTEFKDAVLEMKVKPKITAAKTVSISVNVKKDQKSAQTGAGNEPGIDTREIKTDLLIESGRTVVIGGIYETTKAKNIKKVPFLGDIPYIRRAFMNQIEEDTLTEMLIFLTVTVVDSPSDINIGEKQVKKG